jgi:hypothetical protein
MIIELMVAGVVGVATHVKSKDFVRRRLRFTSIVEKPGLGLFSGAAATVAIAPVVAILPIVGVVTAVAFGAAVGTGVAVGARHARQGLLPEE